MSTISAIIVNYNSGDMLSRKILPLLESSHVKNIIVVDNASEDESLKQAEKIYNSSGKLKFVHNDKNVGFSTACNMAISISAENEYLLFVNPDCRIEHDALEKLIDCMKKFPQVGMVGPLLLNPDGTEQAGGRRAVPTPWRSFVRAFGLYKFRERYPRLFLDAFLHLESLPDKPDEVEAISGACMLVRRKAIDDVGMMDEGYFLHCEDLDWCMRFRQHGWKIMFVPDAPVIHYQGTCSRERPIFVEWHKHKGMVRFYSKFFHHQYPGILFWIVKAGVWLRFTVMVINLSAQKINQSFKAKR